MDAVRFDRVVLEPYGVVLFEFVAEIVFDASVILRLDDKFVAIAERADFAFFDG